MLEDSPEKFVEFEEVNGLPVYRWISNLKANLRLLRAVTIYMAQQLRNIHRRAGHVPSKRLMRMTECTTGADGLEPNTRAMLERIAKSCKAYQRFCFIIHEESLFNRELIVDIMTLSDGKVVHVMCASTKY